MATGKSPEELKKEVEEAAKAGDRKKIMEIGQRCRSRRSIHHNTSNGSKCEPRNTAKITRIRCNCKVRYRR
jgi:hypothetical protein